MLIKTYRHFLSLAPESRKFNGDLFLAADKAVIDSYLSPQRGQQGHVLAVDAKFDAQNENPDEAREHPGYEGRLRLLGRLLWDDLNPQMLMQAHYPADLWPLAKNQPGQVYQHPLLLSADGAFISKA